MREDLVDIGPPQVGLVGGKCPCDDLPGAAKVGILLQSRMTGGRVIRRTPSSEPAVEVLG